MSPWRVRKPNYWVEQTTSPAPEYRRQWSELDALIRTQYADMARDESRSLPVKPNKFRQHRRKA
jgi:hypothetical protein